MSKNKDENSYRSILKGTSVFGGVQVFQILINMVRGKFVALFLGPDGMGVSALLTSATSTVQQFGSLGLNLAIVKEVAANRDRPETTATVLGVAKKLIYATALLGASVCIILSVPLNAFTFGSSEGNPVWFVFLSLMVFFSIAGSGQMAILQGMHAVKRLSVSSLVGATAGLVFGVPLYWLYGTDGIVPAMIILAFTTFVFYLISVRRELGGDKGNTRLVWSEHGALVKKLISLGMVLMAATLIGTITHYGIATFLRAFGSVETVGLYQAANSVTNQYVGMIISAMSLDYFPRLSAVAVDNRKVAEIANRQTEIVAFLTTPLIVLLILSAPAVIRILQSDAFLSVTPLMRWMGFGVLFRLIMFPLGYISYAKDNKRLYFWMEGIAFNLLTLVISLVFFTAFGLVGLGIGILVDSCISLCGYYVVNRHYYGFRYSRQSLKVMAYAAVCGGAALGSSMISSAWLSYTLMSLVLAISVAVAAVRLRTLLRKAP